MEVLDFLVNRMIMIWGIICCNILWRLLKMLGEIGIEGVFE